MICLVRTRVGPDRVFRWLSQAPSYTTVFGSRILVVADEHFCSAGPVKFLWAPCRIFPLLGHYTDPLWATTPTAVEIPFSVTCCMICMPWSNSFHSALSRLQVCADLGDARPSPRARHEARDEARTLKTWIAGSRSMSSSSFRGQYSWKMEGRDPPSPSHLPNFSEELPGD